MTVGEDLKNSSRYAMRAVGRKPSIMRSMTPCFSASMFGGPRTSFADISLNISVLNRSSAFSGLPRAESPQLKFDHPGLADTRIAEEQRVDASADGERQQFDLVNALDVVLRDPAVLRVVDVVDLRDQ
jgi:hypothetical protein